MSKRTKQRRFSHSLGPLQREVLEIVWKLGQASVNDVREELAGKRLLAYTTVLSTMQKLEKAGWLTHKMDGRQYVYMAKHTKHEEGQGLLRQVRERFFNDSPVALFQHLLRSEELSPKELDELQQMIQQRRREHRHEEP